MGDIGSIIIIVIVFRVIFLVLSAWWEVIAGMTLDVTDSSLAKSDTTLLRCRQATRTVAVRG